MSRPRKPVQPISQNEAVESIEIGSDYSTSQNLQTKPCLPTILFCDLVESSFRNWLNGQKDRKLFDSLKRIGYRCFLADPDKQINGSRAEKAAKFNGLAGRAYD